MPWWLGEESRDAVSFVVGLGFGVHEVVLTTKERPFVLGFIVALIGVPVYGALGRVAESFRGDGRGRDE